MIWLGGAILVGLALWFGFHALDTFGLPYHNSQGVVVGKSHRPMSRQTIHNGKSTHTSITPEAWFALLEVDVLAAQD